MKTKNNSAAVEIKNTFSDSFGQLYGYANGRLIRHTYAIDANGSWVYQVTGDYIFNFSIEG